MKKIVTYIGAALMVIGIILALVSTQFSLSGRYAVLQSPGFGEANQELTLDEPIYTAGAGCQNVVIKYQLLYVAGSTKFPLVNTQYGSFVGGAMPSTKIPNPVSLDNLYRGFLAAHADKTYTGPVIASANYYCIDTGKIISKAPSATYYLKAMIIECTQGVCDGELYKDCTTTSSGSYYTTGVTVKGKCGVSCNYDSECGTNEKCDTTKSPNACTTDCGSSVSQRKCYGGDAWFFDTCDNKKSLADDCTSLEKCENGRCIPTCAANQYQDCYNNQIYWFNACNQPGTAISGGDCRANGADCVKSGDTAFCEKTCISGKERKCYGTTNTIWTRDSCLKWETQVEDCGAEGKVCINDVCVAKTQPICLNKPVMPTCNGVPVWKDYPDCKWDTSSCITCDPQKKYESCYNGNVWWFNACDKTTFISKTCGVNQECQDGACIDVCKPITDLSCDGQNIIQKDTCGKTISTAATCLDTEICRLGKCIALTDKTCTSKPSQTCEGAIWLEYPDCTWDESKCNVIDPCNPMPANPSADLIKQCGDDPGTLKLTDSQIIRIWIGGILFFLGLIIIIIGAVI
jgi:hypothetical protein